MPWSTIFSFLKRDRSVDLATVRAAAEEWRQMKDDYKRDAQECHDKIAALERKVHDHERYELNYQREIITLLQENRDLKEQLIFLTNQKLL